MKTRNNKISIAKQRTIRRGSSSLSTRNPFWLPATSYYFLTVAIAFIFFFLIWWILIEGGDETPWIPAGIFASLILISAVLLREVFLRNARNQYILAKKQLDYNLSKLPNKAKINQTRQKFTLQQNSFMLNQIKEKSDAARILKRLPEGHLEVFEICNEYLSFTKKELNYIDKNSPRYSAVRKGRKKVKKAHKYHLLKWAEVESKGFTLEAKNSGTVVSKVESAQKALTVIESALKFYPTDASLNDSYNAIGEFISTVKISNLVKKAEKAAFKGKDREAIEQFNDILFIIKSENIKQNDKNYLIDKIHNQMLQIKQNSDKSESELIN